MDFYDPQLKGEGGGGGWRKNSQDNREVGTFPV